ncbi:MAG: 30S ribosomal protein S17 [Candidatus Altiarchaeota archaeon]
MAEQICKDPKCPFHGSLSTRGAVFEGTVKTDKMQQTVVVQREYIKKNKKFDRYEQHKSRISAHNPTCINAKVGDKVRIIECRKLSKTVSFVVIEKSETK